MYTGIRSYTFVVALFIVFSSFPFACILLNAGTNDLVEADWIDADRHFAAQKARVDGVTSPKINARGVTTVQDAAGGCDGVKNGRFGFHVAVGEKDPWWQVDLGKDHQLDSIIIYNRTDGGHAARTKNLTVLAADSKKPKQFRTLHRQKGQVFYGINENKPLIIRCKNERVTARIVRVFVAGVCHLALDEIEIYGTEKPAENIALGKPADQKSVSLQISERLRLILRQFESIGGRATTLSTRLASASRSQLFVHSY